MKIIELKTLEGKVRYYLVEDIYIVRTWNHERRKGMSKQEVMDDIKNEARDFEALIEVARRK
ncbi:MAG: hypothetical protein LBM69_01975 [Lachnospiraceae bacterium]|jgi:hypothetical protein|nr:hypothetical protein [Lachnospiraceae bacterium]